MKKNFLHTSVFKIGALLFAISFMAVISMFSSVFISDGAQNDALAVNVAGSLRMQSYNILSSIQLRKTQPQAVSEEEILRKLDRLEQGLTAGILSTQRSLMADDSSHRLFDQVVNSWTDSMRPMFMASLQGQVGLQQLYTETSVFVDAIDALVLEFQQHAERNIAAIRVIQSLALFITVILIAFAMLIISRHIEQPLSKLTAVARQLERGDFTAVADEGGKR